MSEHTTRANRDVGKKLLQPNRTYDRRTYCHPNNPLALASKKRRIVMKALRASFTAITLLLLASQATAEVSHVLTQRQLCDLELILNEGFAPLATFMDQQDYNACVETMRLANGSVWPMPITLDVDEKVAAELTPGSIIILREEDNTPVARLTVSEVYKPDKIKEAELVYGTTNTEHPGVMQLFHKTGDYYISGTLTLINQPRHLDFSHIRISPRELKEHFKRNGIEHVVAFQTRNPMHRAHFELTHRAARSNNAHLLIHPAVGQTKPGDIDYITRVKVYQKLLKYYPQGSVTLSLLPLAQRMAGPREALWHALIRKNYGCTHFIVGRDHAGPGKDSSGKDFYGPYDAQDMVKAYEREIGITMVPFREMVYVAENDQYYPRDEVPANSTILTISGTQLRQMLMRGDMFPEWFSFPEVIEELRKTVPTMDKRGFTLFFTGLSGSGKSTLANAVAAKLEELQDRRITILDGDVVRRFLSQGLGFSKQDRSINVRRIGYVASEVTKHGGVAICAPIAPYAEDRKHNRQLITATNGGYIEVHVSTPLEVCEQRDTKGLYQKAREGIIANFTGISDPYEAPENPELNIDTTDCQLEQDVETIIRYLEKEGYLLPSETRKCLHKLTRHTRRM